VLSLADSVVGGLLGSESSTVFDSLSKESDVFDSGGELGLGVSKEALGVDNSLFALSLRRGVGVSLSSGTTNFSLTNNNIFVVLAVSGILFTLFLSNELIDEGDNIINDTFGSEVNL
jgi:hypothetical protein